METAQNTYSHQRPFSALRLIKIKIFQNNKRGIKEGVEDKGQSLCNNGVFVY